MKVAITAWEYKISPVFDSAQKLLIAEIKDKEIISRRYEFFNPQIISSLVDVFGSIKIDVLICGAISETPARIIESSGIILIPFIGGKIEEVLDSYAKGKRIRPMFLMPGCGRRRNKARQRKVFSKQEREVGVMPKRDGTGPQGRGSNTGRGRGGCKAGKGSKGSGRRVGGQTTRDRRNGGGQGSGNKS
ncbi:MAG: hypothetical protein HN737_10220 [Desulfobacterales bacterium]|nr:hypothetical protein [Desulfobacteraceae bacterium]MBT4365382.1 hypothetical protein [Desulfobacteraceae bacterium]MBT7087122.1 hypothetical protein [Desulfobacterales bacterium]MBT7697770.1 hypothetical protein [Desulfobacterales bacterium]